MHLVFVQSPCFFLNGILMCWRSPLWNDSNKGRGEGEGAGTQKGDGIIEVRKVFILSFVVIITLPYKERKCRQQGGLETGVVGVVGGGDAASPRGGVAASTSIFCEPALPVSGASTRGGAAQVPVPVMSQHFPSRLCWDRWVTLLQ